MPGERCPACGTVRTADGCGCHPDATETAVLPLTEGPPLVRPYVPSVSFEQGQADEPFDPALLPAPAPTTRLPAPRELGLFPLATAATPATGRAAARRSTRRSRTATAVAGAGVGIVALGFGIAYALAPAPDTHRDSLNPVPSATADLASATPSADPTGSAASFASGSPTAKSAPPTSASPHTKTAKPSALPPTSVTAAPLPAPTTTAPSPTTSAPTSPSASATPKTLGPGDSGPQVVALQQQLTAAGCARRLRSGTYDGATQQAVQTFQWVNGISGEDGVYGPQTRAALESGATC